MGSILDCGFWAIDRNTFRRVIEDISLKDYQENRKFISNVKFFESLTEDQKDSISSVLITLVFKKGEIIVSEGDMANSFFIIKKGKVSALKDNKELRQMNEGDSFGEQALFQNSVRGATVKAVDETVKCLALAREDLQRILGDKIQVIMYNNLQLWALQKHALLSKLTKIQMERIIENSNNVSYQDAAVVFQDSISKLIIVLEGKLIQSGKVLAEKGQLFGDQYLNNAQLALPNKIVMQTTGATGLLAELDFTKFFEIIGGPLEQIFKKNENSHEVKYMKNKNTEQNQSQKFNLEDFIYIQKLGAGQFGNVY